MATVINQSGRTPGLASEYSSELYRAMKWLGEQDNTIFLGQAVVYPGTAQTQTFSGVPDDRKLEMPVCEEMQMGISTGLALNGFIPISVYPRWNFLLLATNQIVNHLDKIPSYSTYRPKVIIRVGVGSEDPLYPGPQHVGDFAEAFRRMCPRIMIRQLHKPDDVVCAYMEAYRRDGSSILVEYPT